MMSNRPLNVIYVENDPALRGIFAAILKSNPAISEVYDFASGEEAVAFGDNFKVNVALLDVSLGAGVMDGVAVGTQLRLKNKDIGIVLFTQHSLANLSSLVDIEKRDGWSFFQKRADCDVNELVEALQLAAQGKRSFVGEEQVASTLSEATMPIQLTSRQHLVLAMLATGIEPKAIAEKLGISFDSVRKDLSNAYAILVPSPEPGTDLRVTSVLRYQKLTNSPLQHA